MQISGILKTGKGNGDTQAAGSRDGSAWLKDPAGVAHLETLESQGDPWLSHAGCKDFTYHNFLSDSARQVHTRVQWAPTWGPSCVARSLRYYVAVFTTPSSPPAARRSCWYCWPPGSVTSARSLSCQVRKSHSNALLNKSMSDSSGNSSLDLDSLRNITISGCFAGIVRIHYLHTSFP